MESHSLTLDEACAFLKISPSISSIPNSEIKPMRELRDDSLIDMKFIRRILASQTGTSINISRKETSLHQSNTVAHLNGYMAIIKPGSTATSQTSKSIVTLFVGITAGIIYFTSIILL